MANTATVTGIRGGGYYISNTPYQFNKLEFDAVNKTLRITKLDNVVETVDIRAVSEVDCYVDVVKGEYTFNIF